MGIIHPGWLRSSTLIMPMEGRGRFATLLYPPQQLPLLGVQHSVTGNGRVLLICGTRIGQSAFKMSLDGSMSGFR